MTINTRRFFSRQAITILSSTLKVEKKSLLDYSEYEIPLENIHHKKRIEVKTNDNLLVISFACLIFGLIFFVVSNSGVSSLFFTGGILLLTIALITRIKVISIAMYPGEEIRLFFNNRNKAEILNFSDKIIEASNSFLLKKYSRIDRMLPVDSQLRNIEFLRDRDIITDAEYESLKDQLFGRENRSALGFSK